MTSVGTESGVKRPHAGRTSAGLFRTTSITRREQMVVGRIARGQHEILHVPNQTIPVRRNEP